MDNKTVHGLAITARLPDSSLVNIDTYDSWGLVPTSRLSVAMPDPHTKSVVSEFDNYSTELDMSAGHPTYGLRTGEWEFVAWPEDEFAKWYSTILKTIHGNYCTVSLVDDYDWYFYGRLSVKSCASEASATKIHIGYALWPYRTNRETGETRL